MTEVLENSPLTQFTFPRTGKRGVPQQFPRRLYEMLDGEAKLLEESKDHKKVISWSDSGKAFRIYDVAEFSASILPKYFRTKKFSSFQRNLNLYGFTKVRRGPESDMYAHPAFLRDHPEFLLHLRKITNGGKGRRTMPGMKDQPCPVTASQNQARPVSPSASSSSGTVSDVSSPVLVDQVAISKIPYWAHMAQVSPEPTAITRPMKASRPSPPMPRDDRGKLDLLAFALEQASAI